MQMQQRVDLHMHSCYSDGKLNPNQLIDLCAKAEMPIISITDHDNVNGIEEAIVYGNQKGIQVIPGVEVSTDFEGIEVHLLGYFFDYNNAHLKDFLNDIRLMRRKRNELIVSKLNEMGSKISFVSIESKVSSQTTIGRPHIANELNEEGFVNSYYDAFIKYIGDGKPAYVKKTNPDIREAVEQISEAGGLSFIAHPGKALRDDTLIRLINKGIDGLEVIHPSHSDDDIEYFTGIAAEYFLLICGGSDFHGGSKNDGKNFGKYSVTPVEVANMKRRLFS